MYPSTRLLAIMVLLGLAQLSFSQTSIKGKIVEGLTGQPLSGVSVQCMQKHCSCGCLSNELGEILFNTSDTSSPFLVSFVGYEAKQFKFRAGDENLVRLYPSESLLDEVVVTANREGVKRSLAPVAIAAINSKTMQETKATSLDQLLNKVSGVYMVNLGNEQHQMSIRQPMTTKSLFLYLEDGIPVRTTGLFNHNALLEMNMAAVKTIEVIKGPSSSLYGSEAIGGAVNFISIAPDATPTAKISLQGNDIGYKRSDIQTSFASGKWGFVLSGYYADKKNSFLEYSDFHKGIVTARVDYRFSNKTSLNNNITWLDYYTDMPGGIDSAMFASKSFRNPQTFTYRKVNAVRYRSTLLHNWNDKSKSTVSLVYRDNTIAQNPAYAIKDDYRKQGSRWVGNKNLAHGEINNSSFNSYALVAQHKQSWNWKNAVAIVGANADISPSSYRADYIRIDKDSITNKFVSYTQKDSILTHYRTGINNYAGFINFELDPADKLHVVTSLRYDLFIYNFNNHLEPSAFSGSPDGVNNFKALSPKVGFTYNLSGRTGIYANFSQGFVPPQVTEMYRGVAIPSLKPSTFYNYEAGAWMDIIRNKLSADISIYQLDGTNEIVSVRNEDGSSENKNAGSTSHRGIELGMKATPAKELTIRFSGALSKHEFRHFVEKGNTYDGRQMNGAPNWMHNVEVWYRPLFAKGLRLGVEWQKLGSYFMDPVNTTKYEGFDVFHVRAGYEFNGVEIWMNVMNAADKFYAYNASKNGSRFNYTPAEPRNINVGISYNLGTLLKKR